MKTANPHRCKIDCSNPSEVLQHLQSKSDHLYRFWANYNELYSKCRSMTAEISQLRVQVNEQSRPTVHPPSQPPPQVVVSESDRLRIAQLEADNASLRSEIARLKDERKSAAEDRLNEMSTSYDRQIRRLKELSSDKDQIINAKDVEIRKLKGQHEEDMTRERRSHQQKMEAELRKFRQEKNSLEDQLVQLKRQLNRPRTPVNTGMGASIQELEQLKAQLRRKDQDISSLRLTIQSNEQRYQQNLRNQLEGARRDIKAEFQGLLSKLRDGCMSMTTVVETYETSKHP